MAELAVQPTPGDSGVIPTDLSASLVSGAGANTFRNGGRLFFLVTATASAVTITLVNQTTQAGNAGPNKAIAVAANETRLIGPISHGLFNDVDGLVHVTVSAIANVADFYAFSG